MRESARVLLPPIAREWADQRLGRSVGLARRLAGQAATAAQVWTNVPLEALPIVTGVRELRDLDQGTFKGSSETHDDFLRDWVVAFIQSHPAAAAILVDELAAPTDPGLGSSTVRITTKDGVVYAVLDRHHGDHHTVASALRDFGESSVLILAHARKPVCDYEWPVYWPKVMLEDAEDGWVALALQGFDGLAAVIVER